MTRRPIHLAVAGVMTTALVACAADPFDQAPSPEPAAASMTPPAQVVEPQNYSRPQFLLVLPFHTLGDVQKYGWIGPAIQQNLLTELSRAQAIGVAAPTSQPTTPPPADVAAAVQAARDAHATLVVFGNYQVAGNDVRITGQVIDVDAGRSLGSLTATGPMNDLFPLEDRLSSQLKDVLSQNGLLASQQQPAGGTTNYSYGYAGAGEAATSPSTQYESSSGANYGTSAYAPYQSPTYEYESASPYVYGGSSYYPSYYYPSYYYPPYPSYYTYIPYYPPYFSFFVFSDHFHDHDHHNDFDHDHHNDFDHEHHNDFDHEHHNDFDKDHRHIYSRVPNQGEPRSGRMDNSFTGIHGVNRSGGAVVETPRRQSTRSDVIVVNPRQSTRTRSGVAAVPQPPARGSVGASRGLRTSPPAEVFANPARGSLSPGMSVPELTARQLYAAPLSPPPNFSRSLTPTPSPSVGAGADIGGGRRFHAAPAPSAGAGMTPMSPGAGAGGGGRRGR